MAHKSSFDALNDDAIVGRTDDTLPRLHTYEEGRHNSAISRIKEQHREMTAHDRPRRRLNMTGLVVGGVACLFVAQAVLPADMKPINVRNWLEYSFGQPNVAIAGESAENARHGQHLADLRNKRAEVRGWCGVAGIFGLQQPCNEATDKYFDTALSALGPLRSYK